MSFLVQKIVEKGSSLVCQIGPLPACWLEWERRIAPLFLGVSALFIAMGVCLLHYKDTTHWNRSFLKSFPLYPIWTEEEKRQSPEGYRAFCKAQIALRDKRDVPKRMQEAFLALQGNEDKKKILEESWVMSQLEEDCQKISSQEELLVLMKNSQNFLGDSACSLILFKKICRLKKDFFP